MDARRNRYWAFLCLAVVITLTAGMPSRAQQRFAGRTVVVTSYGGNWEEFMRRRIVPAFEQRTGAKVELAVGLTRDWVARMRAAGKNNPPYDVFIGNTIWASLPRQEGHFAKLTEDKVPNLKEVFPELRMKDDIGVRSLLNTIVIAYRKDQLPQAPKRWVDFWDPKYKGKFALYSINNSASFMFIMNTARLFGKDPKNLDVAFQKIRELRPFKQSDFGGDMENLLARNEVQIGLIDGGAVTRLRDQGIPMDLNVPLDGIYTFEQDTNVTEFSKNKDVAFEFVNFMLARDVQEMWARGFYTTPGNRFVKWDRKLELAIPIRTAPHIRQIIWWDWDWLNGGARETMIQRWNREIIGP